MNPILAAILSFIIPGLGQAIEGDVKKRSNIFNNFYSTLCCRNANIQRMGCFHN